MSESQSHDERVGFHDATFRRVDRRVETRRAGGFDDDLVGFRGVRGGMLRSRVVVLSGPDYQAIRASPHVVDGHERCSVVARDVAEPAERTATRQGS